MTTIIENELQYMVRDDANWIIPHSLGGLDKAGMDVGLRVDSYYDTEHYDLQQLNMSLRIRQQGHGRAGTWQFKMQTKEDTPTKRSRIEIGAGTTIILNDSYDPSQLPPVINQYLPQGQLRLVGTVVTESIDIDYNANGEIIKLSLETVTYDDGHSERRIEAEGNPEALERAHAEISSLYTGMLSVPSRSKYQQCLAHRRA